MDIGPTIIASLVSGVFLLLSVVLRHFLEEGVQGKLGRVAGCGCIGMSTVAFAVVSGYLVLVTLSSNSPPGGASTDRRAEHAKSKRLSGWMYVGTFSNSEKRWTSRTVVWEGKTPHERTIPTDFRSGVLGKVVKPTHLRGRSPGDLSAKTYRDFEKDDAVLMSVHTRVRTIDKLFNFRGATTQDEWWTKAEILD